MDTNRIQLVWFTTVCIISPARSIQVECESDMTGFRDVSRCKTYIDKTLLLKELFTPPAMKMITAPHRSGKSTNLDMMRRFLQPPVDNVGEHLPDITDTYTYRLFCRKKRRLKICEDRKFFRENFGQHPVLFVDYKLMNDADSLSDMRTLFRQVVMYAYADHIYLAKARDLWPRVTVMTRKRFEQISDPEVTVTDDIIRTALKRLSHVLYLHYGKPAYVLIDEYNCYLESILIFEGVEDAHKMIDYYQDVNYNFLRSNPYIQRAILTGVFHMVSGWGMSHATDYPHIFAFSRNHRFNQYYGISRGELKTLLRTRIPDRNTRYKLVEHIERTYGGYRVMGQPTILYNIHSALQYLQYRRTSNKTNYWMRPDFLTGPVYILYLKDVMEPIIKMLQGHPICIDISTPLTKTKLDLLNHLHGVYYNSTTIPNTLSVQTYFYLLFELGFLTVYNGSEVDERMVRVKIPNLETEKELAELLLETVLTKFIQIDKESIDNTNLYLNSITAHSPNETVIERAFESMHDIFWQSNCYFKTINEFRRVLYLMLRKGFYEIRTRAEDLIPQDVECDIFLINKHKINFCIKVHVTAAVEQNTRDNIAEYMMSDFTNHTASRYVGEKIMYVVLCYSKYTAQLSISYSKLLQYNETLDAYYLISLKKGPFKSLPSEETSSWMRNSSETIDFSYNAHSSSEPNSSAIVEQLVRENLN